MDRSPDTDSLCALMEQCSLTEIESSKFQAQLADFPHTFQLQDQERQGRVQLTGLKAGLESALSVGYDTGLETARARNLLAYTLYWLHQSKDALRQLELVLEMEGQRRNLVTLANKAVILWNEMRLSEADELVQSLAEMKAEEKEFPSLVVRAKAELAFTYTRLGPSFFPYAIAKFEEVIPKAGEPEKWLWKFGLALTRRRRIRAKPQDMAAKPSDESAAEQRDLLRLLMDIGEHCGSRNLKAKAYSELALLLFAVSKTPLQQEFRFRAHMDAEQACERALELDPEDNSVLCKCGRIFRYRRQTERSRQLLEKALAIRPSSTGYHHLGNTYKALATSEKHKDKIKVPGYYGQLAYALQAGSRGAPNHSSARQFRQAPSGRSQVNRNAPTYFCNTVNTAAAAGSTVDVPTLSLDRDVRAMQRMIKSPPREVTQFNRGDKFIKEALENFQKAIDISQGQNTRAIYDLALLRMALGELDQAYEKFQDMLKKQYHLFPSEKSSVFEQMSLILKEQAETETDEEKKRHMLQNSTSLRYLTLTTAAEIFSESPGVKEHIGELYHSFPVLLQEIEQSPENPHWKLQKKARLFHVIKDHKQSLELLQEIQQMDPKKSEDPEHLKHRIEDYVALGQFEKALTFAKLLKCTPHSSSTMELFKDKDYVTKIQIQACRQALLHSGPSFARLHFRSAFLEATSADLNEESSCEDTDSSEEGGSDTEVWDVAILHDEDTEKSCTIAIAVAFGSLLEDVFGLKVAVTGRDAPPNRLCLEGPLRILKKSTVVVVLAGGKISARFRFYLQYIAKRRSTVTLLVDGDCVPKLLKAKRSLMCPPELLQRCKTAECGKMAEAEAGAVCQSKTLECGKMAEADAGAVYQSKTAECGKMAEADAGAVCQSKTAECGKMAEADAGAVCQSKTAECGKMAEADAGAVCQSKTPECGKFTEVEAEAICQLFNFLVNVDMKMPEA